MEKKNDFLVYLHKAFTNYDQPIGNYRFVKWMENNGNFVFEVREKYKISIIPELLILAYETYKQEPEKKIDYKWLKSKGHNHYCTPSVLKILFNMFDNSLNNKSI